MAQSKEVVQWLDLLPQQLVERRAACPVVYLPLGLCEPHGHIAALGLDAIKAEHLCNEAARRYGGVVAPTHAYHIHESGYHARWLEEVLGETEAMMTSVPPDVFLQFFIYQLRSFANAGFSAALVLTGHGGGNEQDLRLAASCFEAETGFKTIAVADYELVEGKYQGDHAGRYEISQLMAARSELVDLGRVGDWKGGHPLGRLAQGEDAAESNAQHGREILQACLAAMQPLVDRLMLGQSQKRRVSYAMAQRAWLATAARKHEWVTRVPRPGQARVSSTSRWKDGEHPENQV